MKTLKEIYGDNETLLANKLASSADGKYEIFGGGFSDYISMIQNIEDTVKKELEPEKKEEMVEEDFPFLPFGYAEPKPVKIDYSLDFLPFHSPEEALKYCRKRYIGEFSKRAHDDVAEVCDFIFKKDFDIPYSKKEEDLEGNYDAFSFVLPRTANKMRCIGREMIICVGSYAERAARKQCTIVAVKNTDDEYVCCIELRENDAYQVKGFNNHLLARNTELHNAVYAWMLDNKINGAKSKTFVDFDGPCAEHRIITTDEEIAEAV